MVGRNSEKDSNADFNESNIAIVNEQYTADCLSYQFVVNPNQRQYRVEGQEEVVSTKDPLVSAPVATSSLPPQSDCKPDDNYQPCTQKPSGEEGGADPPVYQSPQNHNASESHRPVIRAGIEKSKEDGQDALDEAIEELKAVKDLVCSRMNIFNTNTDKRVSQLTLTKARARHQARQTMILIKSKVHMRRKK